ncbi:MAG: hypothetical protein IIB38_14405, partial [Candidatus Hydrogenedentes bacterium]|nr:hypothetical protein [Candidatus Hydrogenedentota bacterium]
RPIYSESAGQDARKITVDVGQWRSVVDGDDKWVVGLAQKTGEIIRRRYYNLATDPREERPQDWPPEGPPTDAARALLSLCESDPDVSGVPTYYTTGKRLQGPKIPPEALSDARERLEALG